MEQNLNELLIDTELDYIAIQIKELIWLDTQQDKGGDNV